MELSFAQLCRDAQLHDALRRHTDRRAALGQGYELARCRMPAGCFPDRVTLGFFRRTDGHYVIYWKPAVTYRGQSRVLELWFRQSLWSFDGFGLLSARLLSLKSELPAREEPPPTLPTAPERRPPLSRTESGLWPVQYTALRRDLAGRIFGQEAAVEGVAFRLYGFLGKTEPARPLSLVLHGPTGVGKSELAKALPAALALWGGPWQFVWTDLNTYTQPHSVHRLTGAPPGYVGYEDPPVFAAVEQSPRTVFLFDELDKAHPEVLKVFMSILDEGRCTVSRPGAAGRRELDFRRCVLLFTTNLDLAVPGRAVGFSAEHPEPSALPEREKAASPAELAEQLFSENERARQAMTRSGVLREIAGRFSGFVGFSPLDDAARRQIVAQQAIRLGAEYGLRVVRVTPDAALALLPQGESFSIRSALSVLEARLAPLYRQAAGGSGYQLSLSSGRLALSSVTSGSSGDATAAG